MSEALVVSICIDIAKEKDSHPAEHRASVEFAWVGDMPDEIKHLIERMGKP